MDELLTRRLERAYAAARALEDSGAREAAMRAYGEVLALDPADHTGAALRRAALGGGSPERAPPAYVATLFDQHAEVFEDVLVENLGYRVPWLVRERLTALGETQFGRLLDLGCGTGLVGDVFREATDHITGVDLSEDMLALADAKGSYDDLYVGDVLGFLGAPEAADRPTDASDDGGSGPAREENDPTDDAQTWDLVIAADVLPYLGDLAGFFDGCARNTVQAGLLAFSTETGTHAAAATRGFAVGPHQRFAHAEWYVGAALAGAGFRLVTREPIVVRTEEGAPVPGELVLARRS